MLRTLPHTVHRTLYIRLAAIAVFTLLTFLSARFTFNVSVVPFSLQVLVVLLSGLVLGGLDGALSQVAYVILLALGLPLYAGPTGGFLLGFIAAAGITGFLSERGAKQLWWLWIAGVVGLVVLYVCGVSYQKLYDGIDWSLAWAAGAAPFIFVDLAKAMVAAALTEGGHRVLLQWGK